MQDRTELQSIDRPQRNGVGVHVGLFFLLAAAQFQQTMGAIFSDMTRRHFGSW